MPRLSSKNQTPLVRRVRARPRTHLVKKKNTKENKKALTRLFGWDFFPSRGIAVARPSYYENGVVSHHLARDRVQIARETEIEKEGS